MNSCGSDIVGLWGSSIRESQFFLTHSCYMCALRCSQLMFRCTIVIVRIAELSFSRVLATRTSALIAHQCSGLKPGGTSAKLGQEGSTIESSNNSIRGPYDRARFTGSRNYHARYRASDNCDALFKECVFHHSTSCVGDRV